MKKYLAAVALAAVAVGCSRESNVASAVPAAGSDKAAASAPASASTDERPPANLPMSKAADDEEPLPPEKSPYDGLPNGTETMLERTFTGDFDEMVKRRLIRAGVVFNRTHYFIDKGVQRGIAYEAFKQFEDDLNTKLKTGNLKIHVVMVPLQRDQLFPALQAGKVDLVAAALTVTPSRRQTADFSLPTRSDVSEIVVTAKDVPGVATADDLSGREVFVRKSSSYFESLTALNQSLAAKNRPVVAIKEAPEELEDDDILEMVNAGLVDATVMDDFMVEFWRQVFPGVQPQPATVRTGGDLAVGMRKNSPKLMAAVNTWVKKYGARTTFGNTMNRRYLENTNYVKGAASDAERQKLQTLVKFFEA
ncbi:MAG TPA: transporter substrate-binding domain-containing protein, partial [Vicinamibacterales bacterium]|nr:transporter substrate-binding domain-containing protein [Vicinamibacterales bacterium]